MADTSLDKHSSNIVTTNGTMATTKTTSTFSSPTSNEGTNGKSRQENSGKYVDDALDSQELESLQEKEFVPKKWINQVFEKQGVVSPFTTGQGTSADVFAAALLTKLQLLSQDLTLQIDQLSQETTRNLGRVFFDLDALKSEASSIQNDLSSVQDLFQPAVQQVETSSFSYLIQLDKIKHRMEQSVIALKEAEHWSTLESEMENIFASQDYLHAAQRLQEAKRSLALLENTPEYTERKQVLTKLLTQLEQAVEPALEKSFTDRDLESVKALKVIFDKVGRQKDFDSYYFKSKRAALVPIWKSFDEGMVGSHAPKAGELAQFLREFYSQVLVLIEKEMEWIPGVFSDSQSTIANLLEQILTLSPSLSHRLNVVAQSERGACLPSIVECFQVTNDFAKGLEDRVGFNDAWAVPLYRGFESFQTEFGQYCQNWLGHSLASMLLPPEDTSDVATLVSESIKPVFDVASVAVHHCKDLTGGFASVGLIEALNVYFNQVLARFNDFVYLVKSSSKPNSEEMEWQFVQQGLKMMAAFADFDQDLKNFETEVLKPSFSKIQELETEQTDFPTGAASVLLRSPLNNSKLRDLSSQPVLLKPDADKLIKSVQGLVFDNMYAPIQRQLATVATLPAWTMETKTGGFDLPQFSLNPSPYVTRIGEHLLTLPQQLELYLDDPGLAWNVHRLPHVKMDDELPPAALYLSSLALESQHGLYQALGKVNKLTDTGSKQVSTDIDYLGNVVSALDVEIIRKLDKLKELCQVGWNQFAEAWATRQDKSDEDVWRLVSKLRSIQLTSPA